MISLLALNMTALNASDEQAEPEQSLQKFNVLAQEYQETILDLIKKVTILNRTANKNDQGEQTQEEKMLSLRTAGNQLFAQFNELISDVVKKSKSLSMNPEKLSDLVDSLQLNQKFFSKLDTLISEAGFGGISDPKKPGFWFRTNPELKDLEKTTRAIILKKSVQKTAKEFEFNLPDDNYQELSKRHDQAFNAYEAALRKYIGRFPNDHRAFTGIDTDSTVSNWFKQLLAGKSAIEQHLDNMAHVGTEHLNAQTQAMRDAMSAGKAIPKPSTNVDTEHLNAQAKAMQETASPTAAKNNLSAEHDTYV